MSHERFVASAEMMGHQMSRTGDSDSRATKQDLAALDVSALDPLSPQIVSRQATINIGTIGHVAHGKSSLVRALSGVNTVKFGKELEMNRTIMLGYANAKIYECTNPECPRPGRYKSYPSSKEDSPLCERVGCGARMRLVRHVSFVDVPGHEVLMATMLTGAAVMDAALLLVGADQRCPQPQTTEHLAAVELMKMKDILIVQNKVDLVSEAEAKAHHGQIVDLVQGTSAEGAPIIPVSAQLGLNIDVVCEAICKSLPMPTRDFSASPQMTIVRSFDVNRPGAPLDTLVGGVAGGTLLQGVLRVGDEIEVRPGIVALGPDGLQHCTPLRTRVISLHAEQNELQYAVPGGLIGVGTSLDPALCRANNLVGHTLGAAGTLPDVLVELEVSFFLLRRLLGVQQDKGGSGQQTKVERLAAGEILMVNVGSSATRARVTAVKKDLAKLQLVNPVCAALKSRVVLSRKIGKSWRLVGWAKLVSGVKAQMGPAGPQ